MIGLLSYLSTTLFFSPALNLLLIPIAIYRFLLKKEMRQVGFLKTGQKVGMVLILISVALSIVIFIFFSPVISNFEKSITGPFPYLLLILVSMLVGWTFDKGDAKIVIFLVFLEIIVGAAEYILGTHSFFSVAYRSQNQIGETDLLYYNRVYGLSLNSSIYALKVLFCLFLLIVFRSEVGKRFWAIGWLFVAVGFFTSFNRTAIVAGVVSLLIVYRKKIQGSLFILISVVIGFLFYFDELYRAFTRGSGEVDLSGRDHIFSYFLEILSQNPILGNASRKVWLDIGGRLYHAHNSYIELAVSNGIIVTILFFLGYYFLFLRGALLYAAPLLIYSLFQYGLMWGLSFHDVVFFGSMFYVMRKRY